MLSIGDRVIFEIAGLRRRGIVREIFPKFFIVEVIPNIEYIFENRAYRETIPKNDHTYRVLKIC